MVLRRGLIDAQLVFGILDNKGPAHDLSSNIKGLSHNSTNIAWITQQAANGAAKMHIMQISLGTGIRHLRNDENNHHTNDNKTDDHIWHRNNLQIVLLQLSVGFTLETSNFSVLKINQCG